MNSYKSLKDQIFTFREYSIVPIRSEDRYLIMQWRNEQIYHLRQCKPLTKEDQDNYFKYVVSKLFDQDKPEQMLFSFLNNDQCIGYGGLVHINWIDQNAEVSFIMDTSLESKFFNIHWSSFLRLIEGVAFSELELHKLFVYAFDLRPQLYVALQNEKYYLDARLQEHCFYHGRFIDVVIYSKIFKLTE